MMSFRYSLQNFEQSGAIRKLISKLTKASQLSEQGIIILGSGFESLSRYHVSPTTDCRFPSSFVRVEVELAANRCRSSL